MAYFRVTYSGYVEGEFKDESSARAEFMRTMTDTYDDAAGRVWQDFIEIEKFNKKTKRWE
jgi:hypothetical protein